MQQSTHGTTSNGSAPPAPESSRPVSGYGAPSLGSITDVGPWQWGDFAADAAFGKPPTGDAA